MDWNAAIEKNREALKRILASLVAMAGLAGGAAFTSPLWGGRRSSDRRVGVIAGPQPPPEASRRPPHKGEVRPEFRPTLPRHLHRAVLRLLRPAESAVRRLVIVAARGLVVEPPPARPPKPNPKAGHAALRALGIAIVLPHNLPHPEARSRAEPRRAEARSDPELAEGEPRRILLPLFDPLRPPGLRPWSVPAHAAPRILSFDGAEPHRLPAPPRPDDPIDATRLNLRLAALGRALDDLPAQARRFARWRSRAAAAAHVRGCGGGRMRRISPLRPGRPPGQRHMKSRRPGHEVHDVLGDLQYFAFKALEQPDTS